LAFYKITALYFSTLVATVIGSTWFSKILIQESLPFLVSS